MEFELFNIILRNQKNWANEYNLQEEQKKNVRKIIARKYKSKSSKSLEWIKNELQRSLQIGELEILKLMDI
jgi:hypothetical protein